MITTTAQANTPITSNTPAATPTPAPVTPAMATPASTPSGPSLDSLYTQLKTSGTGDANFTGSGDALSGTPYHWQFYVNALEPGNTLNLTTAFPGVRPDATHDGGDVLGWCWTGTRCGNGLSGYGLGLYAGLGDYLSHRGSPYVEELSHEGRNGFHASACLAGRRTCFTRPPRASSAATTTVTDYSVANPYSNPYLSGSGEVPITSTGPLPANYGPQV